MVSVKKYVFALFFVALSNACTLTAEKTEDILNIQQFQKNAAINRWVLNGRLVLHSEQDAWSANIQWQHHQDADNLKLTGLFGLGGVKINLRGGCVTIVAANEATEHSCSPEQLISKKIGRFVPVQDLSRWVLGLPKRGQPYVWHDNGFEQFGWRVIIKKTCVVDGFLLPKTLFISNNETKLKLAINEWHIQEK